MTGTSNNSSLGSPSLSQRFDTSLEPQVPLNGNWLAVPSDLDALVTAARTEGLQNLSQAAQLPGSAAEATSGLAIKSTATAIGALLAVDQLDVIVLRDQAAKKGAPLFTASSLATPEAAESFSATIEKMEIVGSLVATLLRAGDQLDSQVEGFRELSRNRVSQDHHLFDETSQVGIHTRFTGLGAHRETLRGVHTALRRDNEEVELFPLNLTAGLISLGAAVMHFVPKSASGHQRTKSPSMHLSVDWRSPHASQYVVDRSRWTIVIDEFRGSPVPAISANHTRQLGSRSINTTYNYSLTKNGSITNFRG